MTGLLSKGKNHIALEIIDFQNNSFGNNIEKIVSDIQTSINDKTKFSNKVAELEKLIFSRLGLQVKLISNSDLAAVMPFYSNKHSIFIDDLFKGNFELKDQETILKKAKEKKGFVDIKNAKIGGIFSEYKNSVWINFKELFGTYELSAGEVTSVILHELGHAFYVCEYADRFESTNQILANIATEVLSKKKEKDMTYIFKELKKVNDKVTEAEVDMMINGQKTIASYLWFKTIIGSVSSQLVNAKYDESAFEQLADNFTSRFGYGRQLVVALDKLHDYFGNPEKSLSANAFGIIMSTIGLLLMTGLVLSAILAGSPFMVTICSNFVLLFLLSGEDAKDFTYDDLRIRYKRIRNEQIALLKNRELDKEDLQSILKTVYTVDTIINNTLEYRGMFDKISNVLFTNDRKTRTSVKEQQLLEELAVNDLFLMSAKFKSL